MKTINEYAKERGGEVGALNFATDQMETEPMLLLGDIKVYIAEWISELEKEMQYCETTVEFNSIDFFCKRLKEQFNLGDSDNKV